MASEETPIEVLLANSEGFVRQLLSRSYEDPIVWAVVARICIALEDDLDVLPSDQRQLIAYLIASTIRVASPPRELRMFQFLPSLDRLSK